MSHPAWKKYEGKKVLIVGLTHRTGLSAVKLFIKHGLKVAVSDVKSETEIQTILKDLSQQEINQVTIFSGEQTEDQLTGIDFILLSPGVPRKIKLIQSAQKKNIPVYNDIDFIFPFLAPATRLVGVTGTDGKSTVTELIHFVLSAHGKSIACGNNGVPVFEVYDELLQADFVVMELSSYMLEDIKVFHPHVAVVTNVAEDHLDRYDSMEHYAKTKWNLSKFMTRQDVWIQNLDNGWTTTYLPEQAKVLKVSAKQKADLFFENGKFVFPSGFSFDYAECKLKGVHHAENILVSIGVFLSLGVPEILIAEQIKIFPGLPHRLEWVKVKKKIQVYDDSKATTIQSVERALGSFEKNVILILGGRDKGLDFSKLASQMRRVKHLIAYGEARNKIASSLKVDFLSEIQNFDEAVKIAWDVANEGDVILLSPACTSWDQHRDYAERGDRFKKIIAQLDKAS